MLSPPAEALGRRRVLEHRGPGGESCRACFSSILRPVRSHQWIDERSLALHAAVAAKLEAQPELLNVARQNLNRWLSMRPAAALREWEAILDRAPVSEVIDLLRARNPDAARLRQSSPFAGVLSRSERQSILDVYESRRA